MSGYITSIKAELFGGLKKIDLVLGGKNLILVGGNGCGKTQFINLLFENLKFRIIEKNDYSIDELDRRIEKAKIELSKLSPVHPHFDSSARDLGRNEERRMALINPLISMASVEDFGWQYHSHQAVLIKFDAHRKAEIRASAASESKAELVRQVEAGIHQKNSFSAVFESYLVSHITAQAYAESTIDNDRLKADAIRLWFDKLQTDFRELFEDESLVLRFDSEMQAFFIIQEGKVPYRLQQLSSGFSSILSIYAELIARIELRQVKPEELAGVVFIDEIEVHLHVSLQRKIFSFLAKSFPNVQFIVSTHSPFVVSSVNNAVIYDLSRGEEVGDVSMYSYEALLEGLFGVLAVSDILKNKIIQLAALTAMPEPNFKRMQELVSEIESAEDKLDPESSFYLNRARVALGNAGFGV